MFGRRQSFKYSLLTDALRVCVCVFAMLQSVVRVRKEADREAEVEREAFSEK